MHLSTPHQDMDSPTQCKSRKLGERLFKTTKSSSIPHLTDLRKELGYGHPGEDQDIAFKRAIRKQIENFVSTENLRGYRFTKWRTPVHQRGLLEITRDFLDTQGKGPEFWPDTHNSANTRLLQYSKDCDKIHRLMIKVFWRAAREYKRHKPSSSTAAQLFSQPSNASTQPSKPLNISSDTTHHIPNSTHDLRGQSINNPIDVENMQSGTHASGPSTDNDPYAAVRMSFDFSVFARRDETPDESSSSEPFPSSLLAPDPVENNVTAPQEMEKTSGADVYDVPNSPTRLDQTAHNNSKRPAESNSNDKDHQAKVPRQDPSNSEQPTHQPTTRTRGGKKTQNATTKLRKSNRSSKPAVRQYYATEEQIRAAEIPSTSPSPPPAQAGSCAKQGRPTTDKANNSIPDNSTGNKEGRVSAEIRAEMARQAERQATEAAIAAGVDQQPTMSAPDTAGLSEKAQGKRPAVTFSQAPITRAGPSRERESTARPETSTARHTEAASFELDEDEQRALNACEFMYRTNIASPIVYVPWSPSSTIFHMSLATVARGLGLRNHQTIHMSFRGPGANLDDKFKNGNEEWFASVKYLYVDLITKKQREVASTPASRRRKLRYAFYLSDAPNLV
ncbi:hypothetical protein F53441_7280 [Fusarium austroafricanum]|uniref:Uncharacterized protein n=1 Tax=Fusarium austroafricanum TaxID=2364996 RepID=A0A8H4NXR6_9HYPO|nr:hypothetical protein F53441_7280 [Fusarium austroafricanum]